jgi:hypothetical protein
MAQCGATKPHVILTPSAKLRACSGRYRAGCCREPWHTVPQRRSMALYRAIGEIVRFTHDAMGFHGWGAAAFHGTLCRSEPHVMLTPSAQLRACSGRDRAGCCREPWHTVPQRRSMALHRTIGEIVRFTHDAMGFHGWGAAAFHGTLCRSEPHVMLTGGRHRAGRHWNP